MSITFVALQQSTPHSAIAEAHVGNRAFATIYPSSPYALHSVPVILLTQEADFLATPPVHSVCAAVEINKLLLAPTLEKLSLLYPPI